MTPSAIYALTEIFGVAACYNSAVEPQGPGGRCQRTLPSYILSVSKEDSRSAYIRFSTICVFSA